MSSGSPEPIARMIAEGDAATSHGALFDDSRTLEALIGRPTAPLRVSIERTLALAAV